MVLSDVLSPQPDSRRTGREEPVADGCHPSRHGGGLVGCWRRALPTIRQDRTIRSSITRRAALSLALAASVYPARARGAAPFSLVDAARRALILAADKRTRDSIFRFADRVRTRTPSARTVVHVEGVLPTTAAYAEHQESLRDLPAARDLAMAAAAGGDAVYGAKAVEIVGAWLAIYRPSFNPIDETAFENLFVAWDLMPDAIRAPLAPAMARFARTMAEGYLARMPKVSGDTAINNWQSHRVKLATLAAFSTGEDAMITQARAAYAAHLARTLLPDGPTVDFVQRDAIHYVVYNLQPLCTACLAAMTHGRDWFSQRTPSGASLPGSLAWLEPYADGTKTHQEFVNTKVRFDRERAAAGVPGFSGPFEPTKARELFAIAARLDARHWPLARRLASSPLWYDFAFPRPT